VGGSSTVCPQIFILNRTNLFQQPTKDKEKNSEEPLEKYVISAIDKSYYPKTNVPNSSKESPRKY
jgi:hypothetical protein